MARSEQEQRKWEETFLRAVQEGVALDIATIERGGRLRHLEEDEVVSPEELAWTLEELRKFHGQLEAALKHVRAGGSLDDVTDIMWGRNLPR
jgi:hypothetical protein